MALIEDNTLADGYEPERPNFDSDVDDFDAATQLEKMLVRERELVAEADNYFYGAHPEPYRPKESSSEYKELAKRAITNMVPLIIRNIAQLLYVEGYLPTDADELGSNAQPYKAWEANRMNLKQRILFRAALKYGVAYTIQTLEPGDKYPTVRIVSPSKLMAGYDDPVNDEWPKYALEYIDKIRYGNSDYFQYDLWKDREVISLIKKDELGAEWVEVGRRLHGSPYPPVVRYTYDMDIDGRYVGEIRAIETLQNRLNQTVMDRLLVQTFGSWKIRTIAGMAKPSNEEEAEAAKVLLSKDRLLVASDPDTKFGTLAETQLGGFITSSGVDQETMAAVASIPPHYLTGSLNNLGAEAIAEARASLEGKATEIKHALGEGVKQTMRSIAYLMGEKADAEDFSAQVVWHDAQNRSLSQVADALGKLATMLSVPVTELWARIPGVTQSDVTRWKKAYDANSFRSAVDEANRAIEQESEDGFEPNEDAPA
jgi:hypothetical protein